jgi:hypothetical protein
MPRVVAGAMPQELIMEWMKKELYNGVHERRTRSSRAHIICTKRRPANNVLFLFTSLFRLIKWLSRSLQTTKKVYTTCVYCTCTHVPIKAYTHVILPTDLGP